LKKEYEMINNLLSMLFQGLLFPLLDIQRKWLLNALLQMVIRISGSIRFGWRVVGTTWAM